MRALLLMILVACTPGDVGAPCARHSDCGGALECNALGTCAVALAVDAGTTDGGDADAASADATVDAAVDASVDAAVDAP